MISAVDSNVLIDVFLPDATFGPRSRRALTRCIADGALVACDVVWAEVSAAFPSVEAAGAAMRQLGVGFDPLSLDAAGLAGMKWRKYRRAKGRRDRLVPDFLVGAHAAARADRLLTRDRGFYRTYFGELRLIDPTE